MVGKKKKSKNHNKLYNNEKELNEVYNDDGNTDTQADYVNNITHDTEEKSWKRKYENDDTNTDSEPRQKRPKKKKLPLPPESSDKKNKKSIRQIKKEKHAERQAAAEVAAKEQLKSQCINYLSQWKHDRSNWKFMKAKQVWLFKNKFSSNLVPDTTWPILLEYFESAKGNIRNMLLADANKIIKQMDDWTESQNAEETNTESEQSQEQSEQTPTPNKPDDTVYSRARSLIQCLGE